MLTNNIPFQNNSVLSNGFQSLKPNCHFFELQIEKVMVPMVTIVPLVLGSVNVPMSVISTKLYFFEIS